MKWAQAACRSHLTRKPSWGPGFRGGTGSANLGQASLGRPRVSVARAAPSPGEGPCSPCPALALTGFLGAMRVPAPPAAEIRPRKTAPRVPKREGASESTALSPSQAGNWGAEKGGGLLQAAALGSARSRLPRPQGPAFGKPVVSEGGEGTARLSVKSINTVTV